MACTLNERFDYLKNKLDAIGEKISNKDLARIKSVLKTSMIAKSNGNSQDYINNKKEEAEYKNAIEIDTKQTDVTNVAHAVKVELARLKALVSNNENGKYDKSIQEILEAMRTKAIAEIDNSEAELAHILNNVDRDTSSADKNKMKLVQLSKMMKTVLSGDYESVDGISYDDDMYLLDSGSGSQFKRSMAQKRVDNRDILVTQIELAIRSVNGKTSTNKDVISIVNKTIDKLEKNGAIKTILSEASINEKVLSKLDHNYMTYSKKITGLLGKAKHIVKTYLKRKFKIIKKINKNQEFLPKIESLIEKVDSNESLSIDDLNVLFNHYSKKDTVDTGIKEKYDSDIESSLDHTGIMKIMKSSGSPLQKLRVMMSSPAGINMDDFSQLTSEILNDRSEENFTVKDAELVKQFMEQFSTTYSPGKKFTSTTSVSEDGTIETTGNYDIGSLLATEDKTSLTYEVEEALRYAIPLAMNQIQVAKYDILKMMKDPQDIIDSFSFIDDKADVDKLRKEVANGNVPISSLIKDISQVVSDMIGLQPNSDMDVNDRAKYNAGIKALVYAQIVQDNELIKVGTIEFNNNMQYFVKVDDTVLDSQLSAEEISDMKDSITKLTYVISQKRKERPATRPFPVPETLHNNPDIEMSDVDKENIEKRNNTAWQFDDNFKAIAEMAKHDRDQANELFGFVPLSQMVDMNIEDQLLQIAKNETIERELTELLKEFDKIGTGKDFYLNFVVTSPKRTTIMSNITPMDSKIVHRPFINKKSYPVELNGLSNGTLNEKIANGEMKRNQLKVNDGSVTNEESFEVAIAETFGIGVDKMSRYGIFNEIRDIVDIYATGGVVIYAEPIKKTRELDDGTTETYYVDSPYKALKDFIEDNSEPADLSLLIPFTKEKGSHAMAAAIELKKLHIAKQNKTGFTHSLTIEADAISSGPSLLGQMVGWSPQTQSILSKTGIMNQADYDKYEKYTKDILSEHYGIADKDDIVFNMPSLIEAGKIHDKLTGSDKEKHGEVYADLYTHIGVTAADVIDNLTVDIKDDGYEKTPTLFDALQYLVRNSKELFIDKIRNIAKPPVMTNAYGASLGSIKGGLSVDNIEPLFIQSIRGELKENVKHQFAMDILVASAPKGNTKSGELLLIEHMANTNNFKFVDEIDSPESITKYFEANSYYPPSNYVLENKEIKDSLKKISDKTLGDAFEKSMTDNMSEIEDYRDAMKTLDVVHVEMVKVIMDKLVLDERNLNNGKLTKESFRAIIQKMNTMGNGYTLDMFDSQQAFYKEASAEENKESGHGYAQISGPNAELFGHKDGGKITQNAQEKEFVSNMGAYPTTSIHMLDGELMRRALDTNDFTSIYDAVLFPSDMSKVDPVTHEYNKYAPELLAQNNALDITYEKMNKMAEFLNENQELKDAVIEKFNFVENFGADEVVVHDKVKFDKIPSWEIKSTKINGEWANVASPIGTKGITINRRTVSGSEQITIGSNKKQVGRIEITREDGVATLTVELPQDSNKQHGNFKNSNWVSTITSDEKTIDTLLEQISNGNAGGYMSLMKIVADANKESRPMNINEDKFSKFPKVNAESVNELNESSNLYSDTQSNRAGLFTKDDWIGGLYKTINTVAENREELLNQGKIHINHMAVGMTTFTSIDTKDIEAYPNIIRTSEDALGSLLGEVASNIHKSIDQKISEDTRDYVNKNDSEDHQNDYFVITDESFLGEIKTKEGRELQNKILSYGTGLEKSNGTITDESVADKVNKKKYLDVIDSYLSNKEKC